jgi:hypothetical protein
MFGENNKEMKSADKIKDYKFTRGMNPYRIEQLGTRLMMDFAV